MNWRLEARKAALRHGINPNFFVRQIDAESRFDINAGSDAGAKGIAQWMPATAAAHGVDMSSPLDQLDKAAAWMADLIKQHGGWAPALSVYNSGHPDAYKDQSFADGQTYNYVRKIMGSAHPDLRTSGAMTSPWEQPPTALGLGAGRDALASGVTDAEQGAAAIRSQARQNLADIASGGVQPTDAFAKIPDLIRSLHVSMPKVIMPNETPDYTPTGDGALEAQAVALAKKYIGVKYTWGGTTVDTGFDCSGLVQTVWKALGVRVPRTTYEQWDAGKPVQLAKLKAGDALFFTGSDPRDGKPGHEGLYIGQGRFIEAPGRGKHVRISQLAGRSDFVGARRFG